MKRTESVADALNRVLGMTDQQKADEVSLNSAELLGLASGTDIPSDTRRVLAELIRRGFGEDNPVQGRNE